MAFSALMGARVQRKEDPRLITGAGQFTGNIVLPGMRHAVFVRSPYAHALMRGIDTAAALALPGIMAVVTGEALRGAYGPMPLDSAGEGTSSGSDRPRTRHTHYALSVERVRFVGEAVAVVIADTSALAEDGALAVNVDWEPLPVVGNLEAALAPGAPRVFDDMSDNVAEVWTREAGDVDAAMAAAASVVALRMGNQRLAGVPMEGRAVVATPDASTGGLIVWTSTQAAHAIRTDLSRLLRLPENNVRVIAPDVGGGFGVKIGLYPEEVVLAALALRYKLPLRWVESRSEHMLATTHGRAQSIRAEAAVAVDGTVTALRIRGLSELGAYPHGTWLGGLSGMMAVGVYRIPSVDIEYKSVYTHTTPIAAYRGAGRPEAAYYIERLMDAIAAELGLDPAEVRRRNFIPPEAFPYTTPTDFRYDSGEYARALDTVLELAGHQALRAEQQRRLKDPKLPLLGIGLATYVEMCTFGYDGALVRVEPSGTVTVYTGISPHGQGQHTTFAQIVADQLGVAFEDIIVKHGDTAVTPMGEGTMGSRGLVVGGSALWRAVGKVRAKAERIAAHMLEAAPEDIVLLDGRYQVRGVPAQGLSFARIAKRAYSDDLPDDVESGLEAVAAFRVEHATCPFGAHLAVVEIDRETGEVRVRDYFAVDDCGPRVSPMLVEGQVHGGLAQGIAQALLEEMVYDEHGQSTTANLVEYTVPRATHFPNFTLGQTVTPSPGNPLGVKGIGEAATIGSTPAIVNAVVDALRPFGVRHMDMPLRPEVIWRAMQAPRR